MDLNVRAISSPCCKNCSVDGDTGSVSDFLQLYPLGGTGSVKDSERCLLVTVGLMILVNVGAIDMDGIVPARPRRKGT